MKGNHQLDGQLPASQLVLEKSPGEGETETWVSPPANLGFPPWLAGAMGKEKRNPESL